MHCLNLKTQNLKKMGGKKNIEILYVIFLNIKQSHTLIRPEHLLKPFIQGGKGQRGPSKIYLFIENFFKFLEKSNYSGGI